MVSSQAHEAPSQGPLTGLMGTHPLLHLHPDLSWTQTPGHRVEGIQGFIGSDQACRVSVGLVDAPAICLMFSLQGLQEPQAVVAAFLPPSLTTPAGARGSRDLGGNFSPWTTQVSPQERKQACICEPALLGGKGHMVKRLQES